MLKSNKLKRLELKKDGSGYYLSAIYEFENEAGVHRAIFPKIRLPIELLNAPVISREDWGYPRKINLGFGELPLEGDPGYTIETIREKIHDVTIEEIEKKFGYKIRIVKEKDQHEK